MTMIARIMFVAITICTAGMAPAVAQEYYQSPQQGQQPPQAPPPQQWQQQPPMEPPPPQQWQQQPPMEPPPLQQWQQQQPMEPPPPQQWQQQQPQWQGQQPPQAPQPQWQRQQPRWQGQQPPYGPPQGGRGMRHSEMQGCEMRKKCRDMAMQMKRNERWMQQRDSELQQKVERMNQAGGQAKVDAMADVLNTMFRQRQEMHNRMMAMGNDAVRYMGEQAGVQPQGIAGQEPGQQQPAPEQQMQLSVPPQASAAEPAPPAAPSTPPLEQPTQPSPPAQPAQPPQSDVSPQAEAAPGGVPVASGPIPAEL